jgi:disulfide bond formation protein DsbB
MTNVSFDLSAPRTSALFLLVASAGSLLAAFFFQYVIGLQPCILCIWQRWPYAAVIVLTILILTAAARAPKLRAALLALCGVALLFGGGVAVFHVGVEQHWWTGTPGCGVPATANSIEAMRAQIMAAPVVRCDQVAWSLFGISMASYNILISLVLTAVAFISARRAIGSVR